MGVGQGQRQHDELLRLCRETRLLSGDDRFASAGNLDCLGLPGAMVVSRVLISTQYDGTRMVERFLSRGNASGMWYYAIST